MKHILVILFSLLFLKPALSCTCEKSLKRDLKESEHIIIVKIVESFDTATWTQKQFFTNSEIDSALKVTGYNVKGEILHQYKGNLRSEIINIHGDRDLPCSQEFFIGKTYLVFLKRDDSSITTSVCNNNIKLDQNTKILNSPKEYFKNKRN